MQDSSSAIFFNECISTVPIKHTITVLFVALLNDEQQQFQRRFIVKETRQDISEYSNLHRKRTMIGKN